MIVQIVSIDWHKQRKNAFLLNWYFFIAYYIKQDIITAIFPSKKCNIVAIFPPKKCKICSRKIDLCFIAKSKKD